MYYAIQDGHKIHITDYNPDGGELCCADPHCHARLYYQSKTTDQNGHVVPAQFVSHNRKDHIASCGMLGRPSTLYSPSVPFNQAVQDGLVLILSLNGHFGLPNLLWRDFGRIDIARILDTPLNNLKNKAQYPDGRKGHISISMKSVSDIQKKVTAIQSKGGDGALAKTSVTWQHEVMPFHDFYLNNDAQSIALYNQMFVNGVLHMSGYFYTHDKVLNHYGLPRLLKFEPSNKTREGDVKDIRSKAITLAHHERSNRPLILQHQINFPNGVRHDVRMAFTREMYVVATPRIMVHATRKIKDKFNARTLNKPLFTTIHWDMMDDTQYMPANGKPLPLPKSGNTAQGLLI